MAIPPVMNETESSGLIPALRSSFVKFGDKLDKTADKMVEGMNSAVGTTIEKTVNSALGPISAIMQPFQNFFGFDLGKGLSNLINFKRGTGLFGTGTIFRGPLDERTIKGIDPGSTFVSKTLERLLGPDGKSKFDSIFDSLRSFLSGGRLMSLFNDALGIGSLVVGIGTMIRDGILGWQKAEEWGVEPIIGAIGGVLGGTGEGWKNVWGNAFKWGSVGAGIGMVIGGPVGFIVGGIVGAVVGGVLGFFGGERIANWIQSTKDALVEYIADEGWGNIADDFKDGALPGGIVGLALFGPVGFIIGSVLGGVSSVLFNFFNRDNKITDSLETIRSAIDEYIEDSGWSTILTDALKGPGPRVGALLGAFGGPLGLVAGFVLGLGMQAIINFVEDSKWGERIGEIKDNLIENSQIKLTGDVLPNLSGLPTLKGALLKIAEFGPAGMVAAAFLGHGILSVLKFITDDGVQDRVDTVKESITTFMDSADWSNVLVDNLDLGLGVGLGLIAGPFGVIAGFLIGRGLQALIGFIRSEDTNRWMKDTRKNIRLFFQGISFRSIADKLSVGKKTGFLNTIWDGPFGAPIGYMIGGGVNAVRDFFENAGDWIQNQRDNAQERIQKFIESSGSIWMTIRGTLQAGSEGLKDYFENKRWQVIQRTEDIAEYVVKSGGIWTVTRGLLRAGVDLIKNTRFGTFVGDMSGRIRDFVTSGEWREDVAERVEGLRATPVGLIVSEFISGAIQSIRDWVSDARESTIGQWIENAVGGIPEYFKAVGWAGILEDFLEGTASGAARGFLTGGPVGALVGAITGGATNVLMEYLSDAGLLPNWMKRGREAIGAFFKNVNFRELFDNVMTGLGIGMAIGAFVIPGPVGFIVGSLVGAGIGAIWTFFKGEGAKAWLGDDITFGGIISGIFGNPTISNMFLKLLSTIGFPMIGGAIGAIVGGGVPGAIIGILIGSVVGWAFRGIQGLLQKTDGSAIAEAAHNESFLGMAHREQAIGGMIGSVIGGIGGLALTSFLGAGGIVAWGIATIIAAITGAAGSYIGKLIFEGKSYSEQVNLFSRITEPLMTKIQDQRYEDLTSEEAAFLATFLQAYPEMAGVNLNEYRTRAIPNVMADLQRIRNGETPLPDNESQWEMLTNDNSFRRQLSYLVNASLLNALTPQVKEQATDVFTNFLSTPEAISGGGIQQTEDFILRPNGQLIKTHPNDTLVGLKDIDTSMQETERQTIAAIAAVMGVSSGGANTTVVDEIRGLREDMKKGSGRGSAIVQNNYTSRFNPLNVARSLTMEVI